MTNRPSRWAAPVLRRDRSPHQWYYWLAIIIVRTAATNLADLGASDFKLGKIGLTIGLSIVLVLALLLSPPSKAADARVFRLPTTDAKYWAAMFIAGTLGTVIGDMASFDTGLGTAYASLLLGCVLGVVFLLGARGLFASMWFYWLAVVTVRAAGTSVSDFLAHAIGLPASTLLTGVVFVATLLIWREAPPYRVRPREAT